MRWFAFRNALATAAGDFLSTATALFIAIIAGIVSFAETAFTVYSLGRGGRAAQVGPTRGC